VFPSGRGTPACTAAAGQAGGDSTVPPPTHDPDSLSEPEIREETDRIDALPVEARIREIERKRALLRELNRRLPGYEPAVLFL
jgi:hypothetical protein